MTMLMEKREQVIANIRRCAEAGRLNAKVEVDDPQLTREEKRALVQGFLDRYPTRGYRLKRGLARCIANAATWMVNRGTTFEGLEKLEGIKTGAIVTSNHFSPVDNTVVRAAVRRAGKKCLPIVGQESNMAMPALFGFLMRNADIIPISDDPHYLTGDFRRLLSERVEAGEFVLIYPEQEMWFNYRKPRPGKRGAYQFAAQLGVPVVSCFVEIIDRDDLEAPNFVEVGYAMHVLDPIYPDSAKSARQNSVEMCARDYEQKVAAYERVYGRKLDYGFSQGDIAGWVPSSEGEHSLAAILAMGDAAPVAAGAARAV